jgi:hypothetical protein
MTPLWSLEGTSGMPDVVDEHGVAAALVGEADVIITSGAPNAGVPDSRHPRIVPGPAHPHRPCWRLRPQGLSSLAADGVRRPTKDVDANDGVVFDLDTIGVREIRKQADYPALCLFLKAEEAV